MRSVWARTIDGPATRRGRHLLAVAVAFVAALACGESAPEAGDASVPVAPAFRLAADEGVRPAGRAAFRSMAWQGGSYALAGGETVRVLVSASYSADDAVGRRWAEFLGRLVHASELSRLTAYFAAPAEVEELCAEGALGCYANDVLVSIAEPVAGVSAEEVATHEYGHHVAHNRANSPWRAIDWGTKRWASRVNVCAGVTAGTMFPGDEGKRYPLNPGEGFAEAYRVLNERRRGAPAIQWSIVDHRFFPDATALQAVEHDVTTPWAPPRTRIVRTRFAGRARTWSLALPTPLDGDLTVTLQTPVGATPSLELLAAESRKTLSRSLWSGTRAQTLTYRICGERSVVLRVTRSAGVPRLTLRIDAP